jgi:hypothetical protein
MVQLNSVNEGNFESSETTHPTTQGHISEDQKPQQRLQTINGMGGMAQNLPIYMA